jgi:hypothetical protein
VNVAAAPKSGLSYPGFIFTKWKESPHIGRTLKSYREIHEKRLGDVLKKEGKNLIHHQVFSEFLNGFLGITL